jgi:hypothetical protein
MRHGRSLIALALALVLGACANVPARAGTPTRPYEAGDLTLLARYTAKESCSCIFVMEMSEAWCRAFTKASPSVASWSVDRAAGTVSASALLFWRAKARFLDEKFGCVLE